MLLALWTLKPLIMSGGATFNIYYGVSYYIDFSDTYNIECGISCHLDSDFCFAMDCITSYDVD